MKGFEIMQILSLKVATACAVSVLVLAMTACSSGSDDPAAAVMSPPTLVDLSALTLGFQIDSGTIEIPVGGTVSSGDVAFICGDEACTLTVEVGDTVSVTATGGMVTAMDSDAYLAKQRDEVLQQMERLMMP